MKNEREFAEVEGELQGRAYDVTMNGRDFEIVEISYDFETKKAVVTDVKNIGTSFAMAIHKAKKIIVDRLLNAKKGKK